MKKLQARIDDETEAIIENLTATLGLTESELVREGIRLLAITWIPSKQKGAKIVGLGAFESGIPDLGSNKKKHLKGFGR